MSHILGVYYAPEHNRQSDRDYMRALQPPFIRVLQPDVADIALVHQLAPSAVILPRIWDIDDSNGQAVRDLMADPVAAGLSWADRYAAWVEQLYRDGAERHFKLPPKSQMMFCAANEPNQGGDHPQIATANWEFMRRMSEHGLRALVVVWGPGHPNPLPVEDTWRTHYDSLLRVVAASQTTGTPHMVECHEYWRKEGPFYQEPGRDSDWTWLAGRVLRLPYDVPILIGECGVEGRVYDVDLGPHTGWTKYNISPEAYARQIADYAVGLDPRVKGILPFLTDYRDNQWQSFDTHTAHGALLAMRDAMVPQGKPLDRSHTVHVPIIIGPPAQPGPEPTVLPPVTQPTNPRTLDPRVMEAIAQVESGRAAFGQDGRLKIRLEAHILKRYVPGAWWELHFAHGTPAHTGQMWRPSPDADWLTLHTGAQADEWAAFQFAHKLFPEAACLSISMGASQVMGFNHARVGFESAQAMFDVMSGSESSHYVAMCNYMLSDPALHAAVNARDWPEIGRRYNGSAAAGEKYAAAYVSLWGN